jgi:hypothetical protein
MLPIEEERVRFGRRSARVVLALREAAEWVRTSGSTRTRTRHR